GRDLAPPRLGAAGARLRAHARDLRRRLPRRRAVRRGAREGRRRARAGRAVPHPLLGHRVREPQRDEAPALRRGHAASRAARGGAGPLRPAGHDRLGVARRGVVAGDPRDPGGMKQRLLDTPVERVPPELAEQVRAFCEPLDMIVASYVGLTEISKDFDYPREQLAVAFELRAPSVHSSVDDPEVQRVAQLFYDSMPADVVAGGCNFLGPGALAAWHEKAWQVFSR